MAALDTRYYSAPLSPPGGETASVIIFFENAKGNRSAP